MKRKIGQQGLLCRNYSMQTSLKALSSLSSNIGIDDMKLKYTILYVESVPATLEFYENAFGFKTRFMHEAGDYGELETGETTLSFSSLKLMSDLGKNPQKSNSSAPIFEIAFETIDVSKWLHQAIECGATLVQDVKKEPWGQTTSYVSDMNGFLIEICSPVEK